MDEKFQAQLAMAQVAMREEFFTALTERDEELAAQQEELNNQALLIEVLELRATVQASLFSAAADVMGFTLTPVTTTTYEGEDESDPRIEKGVIVSAPHLVPALNIYGDMVWMQVMETSTSTFPQAYSGIPAGLPGSREMAIKAPQSPITYELFDATL